jgi:hypothetical protein
MYIDKPTDKMIAELQAELAAAKAELAALAKMIHEYNHRFSLLERITEKIGFISAQGDFEAELAAELSAYSSLIKNISKNFSEEVANRLSSKSGLPGTGVLLIDETFDYLQGEAVKSGIMFILNVNGGIKHMTESIISENNLQTLISDHIKDAMVAVRSGSSENGMIMVNIGIQRECYELSVTDNGIPFEINTLLSLGKQAVTTHASAGGSGIGFMTTFRTMKESKASLIITELADSKTVSIRFDNKNQYVIRSYRADEIRSVYNSDGGILIEDLIV